MPAQQKINTQLELLGEWQSEDKHGKLISISGTESISRLFHYELQLITTNKQITQQKLCGKSISFSIKSSLDLETTKVCNGIVAKVSFAKITHTQKSPQTEFTYNITIRPKLFHLNMMKHCRIFYGEKKTIVDVIEEILKENKIDYELNLQNKKIFPAETYIQYNESDFDFVSRLMQSAGIFYFFKHEEKKHTLILSNNSNSYFDLQNKKVKFRKEDHFIGIQDITFDYSIHTTNFSCNAFSYTKPEKLMQKEYLNTFHQKQMSLELKNEEIAYLGQIKDINQVTQLVENTGIQTQCESEQIVGKSNYVGFAAGGKLQLEGDHFDHVEIKDYVLTKLDFSVAYDSQYINDFTAIPHDKYIISKEIILKPIVPGLHLALVVDNDGKTTSAKPYCDEKGCVFIKLLWNEKTNMCKANILSMSNGFALPRIGSLVYVLFPSNNLSNDNPVIVGMHNEGLLKFQDNDEWYKNIYMTYPASSDEKIYNYIAFKDKNEEQEIKIWAKKDMNVDIENDELISIKNNSTKIIKEGDISITTEKGKICIHSKGPIQIETDGNFEVNAKGNFKVNANGAITLNSKQGINMKTTSNISLDAKQNIESKAALSSKYESGTSTIIKGNVQVSIDGTVTDIKGKANVKISAPLTKIGM